MEKRDYVNLQEIEKQAKSPDYKGTINVNAISEQEIVKPYLDKIKRHLEEEQEKTYDCFYYVELSDLIDMIDNLLSEQGDTE